MKTAWPVVLSCLLYLASLGSPDSWSRLLGAIHGIGHFPGILLAPFLSFPLGFFEPLFLCVSACLALREHWLGAAVYGFGNLILMSVRLAALELMDPTLLHPGSFHFWLSTYSRFSGVALLAGYSAFRFHQKEPGSLATSGSMDVIAIIALGLGMVMALAAVCSMCR